MVLEGALERGGQHAGLRIFDISNPIEPKEVAYFVPSRRGDINPPTKFESWRRADVNVFVGQPVRAGWNQ